MDWLAVRRSRRWIKSLPVVLVLCCLLALASSAAAADCLDYREPYLRSIASVPAPPSVFEPVVAGNLLIVPVWHSGFRIYSLANPDLPELLGSMNLPLVEGVAVLDDLVIVANGTDGLAVVDIARPSAPMLLGAVDTPGLAAQVAASGQHAYVADCGGGLQIVNLTNPASPVIVASLPAPGGADRQVQDVAVNGQFAFLACDHAGLLSVDVSSPAAPVVVDTLAEADWCRAIVVDDNYAYLTCRSRGLSVVNISDPHDLHMEGTRSTGGPTDLVCISGTHALLFDYSSIGPAPGPGVLFSLDVCDPMDPRVVGRLREFGSGAGVAIAGDRGYVADWEGGITVIDARNLESPSVMATVGSDASIVSAGSGEDFVYLVGVPESSCGMVSPFFLVMDLIDPASPLMVGSTDLFCCGYGNYPAIAVSGSYVYVPDKWILDVISVADPSYPTMVGSVQLPDLGNGVALVGSYALVACGSGGLQVVDVSDPSAPAIVASYGSGGDTRDVTVEGTLAYVGAGAAGLDILDITNPLAPVRIALLDTPGYAGGVAVVGHLVFLADYTAGLAIVDCTTPSAPVVLGTVDTPGSALRVAMDQGIAYVADGPRGLQAIDVHDVHAPVLLGSVPVVGYASGISVDADYVYLVAGSDGFQIRPKQCAVAAGAGSGSSAASAASGRAPTLAISPNPATSAAQISLVIDPADCVGPAGEVRLRIYDVSGRGVRELAGGRVAADRTEYFWDGRDDRGREVASGVYLVRAEWEGGALSGRVALVR